MLSAWKDLHFGGPSDVRTDLEEIRKLPSYKTIVKTVLKKQIHSLLEELCRETGEESMVVTINVCSGTLSSLGSARGTEFLDDRDDILHQFFNYCQSGTADADSTTESPSATFRTPSKPTSPRQKRTLPRPKAKKVAKLVATSSLAANRSRRSPRTPKALVDYNVYIDTDTVNTPSEYQTGPSLQKTGDHSVGESTGIEDICDLNCDGSDINCGYTLVKQEPMDQSEFENDDEHESFVSPSKLQCTNARVLACREYTGTKGVEASGDVDGPAANKQGLSRRTHSSTTGSSDNTSTSADLGTQHAMCSSTVESGTSVPGGSVTAQTTTTTTTSSSSSSHPVGPIRFMRKYPPKERVNLSLPDKIGIIEEYETGPIKSHRKLAEKHNISKSAVAEMIKNKAVLQHAFMVNANTKRKRFNSSCRYSDINALVWSWYKTAREAGIQMSGPMIQEKALQLAKELRLSGFKASNGWLHSWKSRYNVPSFKDDDSVKAPIIRDYSKVEGNVPAGCDIESARSILNMGTPLFNCIPLSGSDTVTTDTASVTPSGNQDDGTTADTLAAETPALSSDANLVTEKVQSSKMLNSHLNTSRVSENDSSGDTSEQLFTSIKPLDSGKPQQSGEQTIVTKPPISMCNVNKSVCGLGATNTKALTLQDVDAEYAIDESESRDSEISEDSTTFGAINLEQRLTHELLNDYPV